MLTTITLFMANFAIWPTQLVITLFLIDIAEAFNSSPGVVGQVQTLSSALAVVVARARAREAILMEETDIPLTWCYCSGGYGKLKFDVARARNQ